MMMTVKDFVGEYEPEDYFLIQMKHFCWPFMLSRLLYGIKKAAQAHAMENAKAGYF